MARLFAAACIAEMALTDPVAVRACPDRLIGLLVGLSVSGSVGVAARAFTADGELHQREARSRLDLTTGTADLVSHPVSAAIPLYRAGKRRILAGSADGRLTPVSRGAPRPVPVETNNAVRGAGHRPRSSPMRASPPDAGFEFVRAVHRLRAAERRFPAQLIARSSMNLG